MYIALKSIVLRSVKASNQDIGKSLGNREPDTLFLNAGFVLSQGLSLVMIYNT